MDQTKMKGGPLEVRTRKVKIEIPEGLCNLLEKVCTARDTSIQDYAIGSMVKSMELHLQLSLAVNLDLGEMTHYDDYLETLTWPETVTQEAKV